MHADLHELSSWLMEVKKLVIIGIGNILRSDDAFGVEVIRRLEDKVPKWVHLIDAGTVPESYISVVERFEPSHIILIDSAQLGLNPGEALIVDPKDAEGLSFSTHSLPLALLSNLLEKYTEAKVLLIGVQPTSLEFGEGLSKEAQDAVERLTILMLKSLSRINHVSD